MREQDENGEVFEDVDEDKNGMDDINENLREQDVNMHCYVSRYDYDYYSRHNYDYFGVVGLGYDDFVVVAGYLLEDDYLVFGGRGSDDYDLVENGNGNGMEDDYDYDYLYYVKMSWKWSILEVIEHVIAVVVAAHSVVDLDGNVIDGEKVAVAGEWVLVVSERVADVVELGVVEGYGEIVSVDGIDDDSDLDENVVVVVVKWQQPFVVAVVADDVVVMILEIEEID